MELQEKAAVYEFHAPSHILASKELKSDDNADDWFDPGSRNAMVPSNVTSWGNAGPSNLNQRRGPSRQPRRSAASQTRRRSLTAGRQRARRSAMPKSGVGRNAKQVSSEQQEVERMRAMQKGVAEQCKENEASFKAAVSGSQPARKLVLRTTVPMELNFHTDERLKQAVAPQDSTCEELDFASQLRKNQADPANGPRGATVPKPFNMTTSAKRKRLHNLLCHGHIGVSLLFRKPTPACYHLRGHQREEVKSEKLKITHLQTPQLMKRPKMQTFAVKSSAEAEEELEKIRCFKFKALELNRNILGIAAPSKKPAPKEPTQQEPFRLETDRRIQERQANRKPEERQDNTFRSRPVPLRILEGVVGVPLKKVRNPTVPVSPAFARKKRVRRESKVKPLPKFKALPLPDFRKVHLPEKKVAAPTQVKPFQLPTQRRATERLEFDWALCMEEARKRRSVRKGPASDRSRCTKLNQALQTSGAEEGGGTFDCSTIAQLL